MTGSPAGFEVLLTAGAERDLESIYEYISEFDSVSNANRVLDRLMAIAGSLAQFPERGSCQRTRTCGHQGVPPNLV